MIHAVWHFLANLTNTGAAGASIGLGAVGALVVFAWIGSDD